MALVKVNKAVLKAALHRCKKVTLDIDATEIVAHKVQAQWTYNKRKGFMPMVGHVAETGQIADVDFRQGNVPPAKGNLAFIKQCQQSLPEGCAVGALRIDAAGYQTKIIEYCDTEGIEYAIRAKTSAAMRAQIAAVSASDWMPFHDKKGEAVSGQDTYRTSFCIGEYEKPFTLIIQRTAVIGQTSLDLGSPDSAEEINSGAYIYRAIATNRDSLSDSEIVHWPNMTNMATWRGQREPNQGTEARFWWRHPAVFRFCCQCTVLFNFRALLQFICPHASVAAGGVVPASCDNTALAAVRHRGKSG